jgi:hypothetical protein
MAPGPRKRSHSDMQHTEGAIPAEYNDEEYFQEVLELQEGQTEGLFDDNLAQEAEKLGIKISRPPTPNDDQNAAHNSMCESALTAGSHHRTASSGSRGSASTGITSRSSNEQSDNPTIQQSRKRSSTKRSLSFSEYQKYLADHEAQEGIKIGGIPTPLPGEPAPSLFSVSTRKSYASIKNGFKNRFRLRRTKTSQEDLK